MHRLGKKVENRGRILNPGETKNDKKGDEIIAVE